MMVLPFATSESIGEHPKIFVANGTHSLYPMAGTFAVSYSAGAPDQCGLVEPIDPEANDPTIDPAGIFGLKVLATGMLGSVLGPLALVIGAIAATLEGVWPPHGLSIVGDLVAGPADITGAPGSGKVVRPESGRARRRVGLAELAIERGRHHRREVLRTFGRPRQAALVAERFRCVGISGALGTSGGKRSLWQARGHEIPDVLEDILSRFRQRQGYEGALTTGAWRGYRNGG